MKKKILTIKDIQNKIRDKEGELENNFHNDLKTKMIKEVVLSDLYSLLERVENGEKITAIDF